MDNYAIVNGKRINLSDEQIKQLTANKDEIFNPSKDKVYYFIDTGGHINNTTFYDDSTDDKFKKVGNCCTDREIMRKRAYQETLNRLLWRFSMKNGMEDIDWNNAEQDKYYISYSDKNKSYRVAYRSSYPIVTGIFFSSKEVAQRAIDEIILPFIKEHPNFKEE